MKRKSGLVAILWGLAAWPSLMGTAAAATSAENVISLSRLLNAATDSDPAVQADALRARATAQDANAALARAATFEFSHARMDVNTSFASPTAGQIASRQSLARSGLAVQLVLSVKMALESRGLRLSADLQDTVLQASRMQLALDASNAYFAYFAGKGRLAITNELLDELEPVRRMRGLDRNELGDIEGLYAALVESKRTTQTSIANARARIERYLQAKLPPEPHHQRGAREPLFRELDFWIEKLGGQPSSAAASGLPATEDEALQRARNSPVLIQAGLSEAIARNQWYLAMSEGLPQLVLRWQSINGPLTFLEAGGVGARATEQSLTAALVMTLSPGQLFTADAERLRTEAARLDSRTVRLNLQAGIAAGYASLRRDRQRLENAKQALMANLIGIRQFGQVHGGNDHHFTSLVSRANEFAALLENAHTNYFATVFGLHAQIGTLLQLLPQVEYLEGQIEGHMGRVVARPSTTGGASGSAARPVRSR